jgi:hypothetical protein
VLLAVIQFVVYLKTNRSEHANFPLPTLGMMFRPIHQQKMFYTRVLKLFWPQKKVTKLATTTQRANGKWWSKGAAPFVLNLGLRWAASRPLIRMGG